MSACEKCWGDAYFRSRARGGFQSDHYHDLLEECRDNLCSPTERLGPLAAVDEEAGETS